jgi:hypothetical protein
MTSAPHTVAASAPTSGLEVLAEMREFEAAWRAAVAGYSNEHGDIRPECYQDYDEARVDHGGDLADRVETWIDRLAAALEAPPQT